MANPIAVRTLIARFVAETCQAARKIEKGRQKEIEDITRKEMDIAISSLAISAACPPLPAPPAPPPPPPPQKQIKPIKCCESEPSSSHLYTSNGINGSKGPLKSTRQSKTSSTACSFAPKSTDRERRCEEDSRQEKNPFLVSDVVEKEHQRRETIEVTRDSPTEKDVRRKNEGGTKKLPCCSAGNPFGDDESD